jgi:hypothetical protein
MQRDELEASWLLEEPTSREAFTVGDRLLREWTAATQDHFAEDRRPGYVQRYWRKRNQRCGLPLD